MIENLRKYTVLIFIVIVALLIGFTFMDTGSMFQGAAGGGTRITVSGHNYSPSEFVELGSGPLQLASNLQSFDANGLEIMRFTNSLVQGATGRSGAEAQFFVSRVILRDAFKKYGIHPSPQTVNDFITSLSIFSKDAIGNQVPGATGEFSQEEYNRFATQTLPYLGLTEQIFRDLISDVIASTKLRQVIGGGLAGSPTLATNNVLSSEQKITAQLIDIDTAKISEKIQPTEEEIKEYWETLQDKYKTEPRIKLTYLLAQPEIFRTKKEEKDDEEKEADTEKTEEQKKIDKEFAGKINVFYEKLTNDNVVKFEELAKEQDWKLTTTDWVTPSSLPQELQQSTRGTWADRPLAQTLFEIRPSESDALSALTLPISLGEHAWLICRIDEREEVRVKTFEEAKEEAARDYKNEKTDEIVRKNVEETIEKLQKAIDDGKSLEEAAKENNLELRDYGPYGSSDEPVNEPNAQEIFGAAATVNPGNFAETLFTKDKATIIHVSKREIVKDDNRSAQIDGQLSQLENFNEHAAFTAWLNQKIGEARVVDPFANQN